MEGDGSGGLCGPSDRAHAVPAVEATLAVGWCGHVQQAHHGDAGAATVERKAGGSRGKRGRRAGAAAERMRDFF